MSESSFAPRSSAAPAPCFACLYRPPAPQSGGAPTDEEHGPVSLIQIAEEFSSRFEQHREDLVSIDVSGLERLLGPPRVIGEAVRRTLAARGVRAHVAIAGIRMAALVLAHARPGLTVVDPGDEPSALAPLPVSVLRHVTPWYDQAEQFESALRPIEHWGIGSLGALAALPRADLAARLGPRGLVWHAIARGEEVRPLVPTLPDERFQSMLELEWPIEGLEPLSFVLTRLIEPLCTRLERRDRGAAVLHVHLRLVTDETHVRRLQLPTPLRDVRTLRTLALLDLESHPPGAAIDQVTVTIDPTPGRVLQHTLFTRPHPTPEQLSTLLARLGALMGQDRIGAASLVDSHRPGAFHLQPFGLVHDDRPPRRSGLQAPGSRLREELPGLVSENVSTVVSSLRRCRQPVPARVAVDGCQRPVRVTTDRRGFAGGSIVACAGPWRTSGSWWASGTGWNRDEWEVALGDGALYRLFRDRDTDGWFIDAIVD